MCWIDIKGKPLRNVWPLPKDLVFLKAFTKHDEIKRGSEDAKRVYAALKNYPNIPVCITEIWTVYDEIRKKESLPCYECAVVVREIIAKKKMKLFVGCLCVVPKNNYDEPICYTLFRTSFCNSKKGAQQLLFYLFLSALAPDYRMYKECSDLYSAPAFSIVDTRDTVFDVNGHTVIEQALELLSAAWDRTQESEGSAAAVRSIQRHEDPSVSRICGPDQNRALTLPFKKLMQCKRSYAEDGAKVKFRWSLESRSTSETKGSTDAPGENPTVTMFFFRVQLWRVEDATMQFPRHGGLESEAEPEASFSSSTAEDSVVSVLYQCLLEAAKKWSCATLMEDLFKEFALSFVFPVINIPYRVAEVYCDAFFGCRGEESPILSVECFGSNLQWNGLVHLNLRPIGGIQLKNFKEEKVVCCALSHFSAKKKVERDGMVWFGRKNFYFVSHMLSLFEKDKYPLSEVTTNFEQLLEKCDWEENTSTPTTVPSFPTMKPSPSPSGANDTVVMKDPATGSFPPTSGAVKRMRDESRSAGIATRKSNSLTVQMTPHALVSHPGFRVQLSPKTRGLLLLMDHLWKPFFWMLFRMEEDVHDAETGMESASHDSTTPHRTNANEEKGHGVKATQLRIALEVHRCSSRSGMTTVENGSVAGATAPSASGTGFSSPFPQNTYVAFTCYEEGTEVGNVLKKVLQKALTVLVSYRQMVTEGDLFTKPTKYEMPEVGMA